jgi:signal peptidase I
LGSRTGFSDGREEQVEYRQGLFRELAETVLVFLIFFLFVRAFLLQPSEIPSASMEDTILIGDYILVNRFIYAPTSFDWERNLLPIRDIRRGDVVVFKKPQEPEIDYIKRVIGLPGETVEVRRGYVYINGQLIDEPYVGKLYRSAGFDGTDFGPERVPAGQYFMMGDHRNRSADSRVWGTVPAHLIKGRAILTVLSTSAKPPEGANVGQVTLRSLGRKLFGLVFNMRWDRALRFIH